LPYNVGSNALSIHKACLQNENIKSHLVVKMRKKYRKIDGNTASIKDVKNAKFVSPLNYFFLLKKYDIIHYNFGSTFSKNNTTINSGQTKIKKIKTVLLKQILFYFSVIEIKWMKKKSLIYVHYQGDDARDYSTLINLRHRVYKNQNIWDLNINNFYRKKYINLFEKYADKIFYLNPDLSEFLPRKAIFIPYSLNTKLYPNQVSQRSEIEFNSINIGHAPTNRALKGTDKIKSIFENSTLLRKHFNLHIIENINHKDMANELNKCEVFIDQIEIGWYGAAAVEAMLLNKVIFCFIDDKYTHCIPPQMLNELPIINCNEKNLEYNLLQYLAFSEEKKEIMRNKTRSFAFKWHEARTTIQEMYEPLLLDLLHEK